MATLTNTESSPIEDRAQQVDDSLSSGSDAVNPVTAATNETEPFFIEFNENIRLYFLRYGLFPKHNIDEQLIAPNHKENEEESLFLPPLGSISPPDLEHFYIGRTTLNSGYLYIFDEEDNDLFYEYKIDISGKGQTIYEPVFIEDEGNRITVDSEGRKVGDIANNRISSGNLEVNKYFKEGQILWIGYSQMQWTGEYYQQMVENVPEEKEALGLIRIECIPDKFDQEHVLQQTDVRAVFREDQNDADLWLGSVLSNINEYETFFEAREKRDMFVVLSDPIGCALDISTAASIEIINHRANIEAMRTGRDPDSITYKMINRQEQDPYDNENLQHMDMFTLAQTSYHLVYGSQEMQEQFGSEFTSMEFVSGGGRGGTSRYRPEPNVQKGVEKEKLENVLGVIERKEHRLLIQKLQNDLCLYIEHTYYITQAFKHHINIATPICKLDVKTTFLLPFEVLVINPRDIDRTIDLEDAFPEEDEMHEPCIEVVKSQIAKKDDSPIYRIYNERIEFSEDVLESNWEDISNKLAGYTNSILNIYSESNIKTTLRGLNTSKVEILFTNVRVSTRGPGGSIPIVDFQQESLEQALRREADVRGVSGMYLDQHDPRTGLGTVRTYEYNGTQALRRLVPDGENFNVLSRQRGVGTLASINIITINRLNAWTDSIVSSPAFSSVLSLLQIFNWVHTADTFKQNPSLYNGVSLMGTTSDLISVTTQFTKSLVTQGAVRSSFNFVSSASGIAGGGITVMMSAWNSVIAFGEYDRDSGIAYAGAAAAFAISTAASTVATTTGVISATSGILAWAGPVAWVIGAIAIGLFVLAIYLRDSDLESFFKNYTFGTHRKIPLNGRKAWEYNNDLFEARMNEVSLNNQNSDFRNSLRDLEYADNILAQVERHRLIRENDVSNLERSGRQYLGTSFNTLDTFSDELAMLLNFILFNGMTISPKGNLQSAYQITMPLTGAEHISSTLTLSTRYEAQIQFASILTNREQIEFKVLIGSEEGRGNNQMVSVTTNGISFSCAANNTSIATISFSIPQEALEGIDSMDWVLLFLFRLNIDSGRSFPFNFSDGNANETYVYSTISLLQSYEIEYISSGQEPNNQRQSLLKTGNLTDLLAGNI